jgi:hypothetical protein
MATVVGIGSTVTAGALVGIFAACDTGKQAVSIENSINMDVNVRNFIMLFLL